MAPGGRRSAAESPVRPFWRPVGEAGDDEVEALACGPVVWRDSITSTSAHFLYIRDIGEGEPPDTDWAVGCGGLGSEHFTITGSVTGATYVNFRVTSFDVSEVSSGGATPPYLPSDWFSTTLSGGGFSGDVSIYTFAGGVPSDPDGSHTIVCWLDDAGWEGQISGYTLEWQTDGTVSDVCSDVWLETWG